MNSNSSNFFSIFSPLPFYDTPVLTQGSPAKGLMYSKGQFKEVLFYKEDVMKHAERTYHPGQ